MKPGHTTKPFGRDRLFPYSSPMPQPGKRWFHITFGTRGSWLPGDPRGFRSRRHKLHSSGDHRNPPPAGEHRELHQYSKQCFPQPILIPKTLLPIIGEVIILHAQQNSHRLLAVSIAPMHVHMLIELPRNGTATEVGRFKRRASVAVSKELPGRIWTTGCGIKPIRDKEHQINTFNYILKHKKQGAWVWSYRDDMS